MIHFKIDPEKYGRVNFWSLEGYEILIFENLCDLLFQKSRMDQWVGVHSEYTQYYRPSPPEPFLPPIFFKSRGFHHLLPDH